MKKQLLFYAIILITIISSCGIKRGYLQFKSKNDELIATDKIKVFMKKNPNPSIVLRVPQASNGATQSDQNSYVYSAIEKELVIAGFKLKDRGLLNQVVNSQSVLDYQKLSEYTDLILELVKVDTKVPFNTNVAYTRDGTERVLKNINYTRSGASIEFKIILVKNNEYGGSYSFFYAPCPTLNDNCYCKVPYKYVKKFYPDRVVNFCGIDKRKAARDEPSAYETVPQDEFEIFVRKGVKKVIDLIKQ
ncbi:MAG: hypothetical protein WAV23_02935 [Minisyncoccia bacterium]